MLSLPTDLKLETEIVIQKSRFITQLARTDSEAAARDLIHQARATHPSARHHCSAFIIAQADSGRIERSSDDGEPAGTAGMPMLDTLKSSGINNVTAVVIRYFGGIKLGTGGLVRAYSESVQTALQAAPRVELRPCETWAWVLPVAQAGRAESEVRGAGFQILDLVWESQVTMHLALDDSQIDQFKTLCAQFSQGKAQLSQTGTSIQELPLP